MYSAAPAQILKITDATAQVGIIGGTERGRKYQNSAKSTE